MEVVQPKTLKVVCISAESRSKYHLLRIDDVAYSAGFMDHKIIKHQSKRRIPSEQTKYTQVYVIWGVDSVYHRYQTFECDIRKNWVVNTSEKYATPLQQLNKNHFIFESEQNKIKVIFTKRWQKVVASPRSVFMGQTFLSDVEQG